MVSRSAYLKDILKNQIGKTARLNILYVEYLNTKEPMIIIRGVAFN